MNITLLICLIIILAVIALTVIFALRGKKDIIYKMIFTLVNEAEEFYGSKAGKRKFAYVVEKLYSMLPSIIKLFITYSMIEEWIEKALAEAKEYWAERVGVDDEDIIVHGFVGDTPKPNEGIIDDATIEIKN